MIRTQSRSSQTDNSILKYTAAGQVSAAYLIDTMDVIRRHYNFFGRVQGVGFRYTAMYAADNFGVTGWVRNEYDGSVTMEIQGTEEQLDKVVQAIGNTRYIVIDRTLCRNTAVDKSEKRFRVRY